MKTRKGKSFCFLLTMLLTTSVSAQIGQPYIHDPSTIGESGGKYFTFGTGSSNLVSEDGWTWRSGGVRPGGGVAPDIIRIGDRFLVAFARGAGGNHASNCYVMWTKSLDPDSPDFGYGPEIFIAGSTGFDDCDAIDPGLFQDPKNGSLWMVYGTYFGFIRLVEMDPKTGERIKNSKEINVAIDCEAATITYNDGWYYLLATHGTCCDGTNSTYNIVAGRSKSVTGPYVDNVGRDMLEGGGKMVIGAGNRKTGAGHFGRYIVEEGVEKMSFHWEADFDLGGRSTLAIHPLLWKNGWPVAGDLFKEGTYEIESERRGYALELTVDFVRLGGGGMRGMGGGAPRPATTAAAAPQRVAEQLLSDVIANWPKGNIDVRCGDYMFRPHQKWTITEVKDQPGYLGGLYYKIVIEGTNRALAATADCEVTTVPQFTGAPEQLWRIDQLTDGTYRIMPKSVPGTDKKLCLVSISDSNPTLAEFDFNSDNSKWNFRVR